MLAEMTADQFQGWVAYFELEPWGGARDDYRAGMVAAAAVNAAPFRGRAAKTFAPADFFPELKADQDRPRRRQTDAEMAEFAVAMTRRMGGSIGTIRRE